MDTTVCDAGTIARPTPGCSPAAIDALNNATASATIERYRFTSSLLPSNRSERWWSERTATEIDHGAGQRVTVRPLITPAGADAPAGQRPEVARHRSQQGAAAGAVLGQQPEMIARAQVGDAGRGGIVASHPLVPDVGGRHHQSFEAGAVGTNAPVDLFAVDEEGGVEHADALHHRHPHQDGAAAHPVGFEGLRVLAGVAFVLAAVGGAPIAGDHAARRLDDLRL